MEDQVVTFQTARLLKQAGFSVPCLKAYVSNDGVLTSKKEDVFYDPETLHENWNRSLVFTMDLHGCYRCSLDNKKYFEAWSAPSLNTVIDWLFINFGIFISTDISLVRDYPSSKIKMNSCFNEKYYTLKRRKEVLSLRKSRIEETIFGILKVIVEKNKNRESGIEQGDHTYMYEYPILVDVKINDINIKQNEYGYGNSVG